MAREYPTRRTNQQSRRRRREQMVEPRRGASSETAVRLSILAGVFCQDTGRAHFVTVACWSIPMSDELRRSDCSSARPSRPERPPSRRPLPVDVDADLFGCYFERMAWYIHGQAVLLLMHIVFGHRRTWRCWSCSRLTPLLCCLRTVVLLFHQMCKWSIPTLHALHACAMAPPK